jgi:transcriptional regulator of acetoin/glycerol metabolism
LVQLRKALGIKALDEVKRDEITRVLVLAKGDKVLTAALLGLGKSTVYRLLEE